MWVLTFELPAAAAITSLALWATEQKLPNYCPETESNRFSQLDDWLLNSVYLCCNLKVVYPYRSMNSAARTECWRVLYLELLSSVWRWRVIFEDHGLRQIDETGKSQTEGGRTKGEIVTPRKNKTKGDVWSTLGQKEILWWIHVLINSWFACNSVLSSVSYPWLVKIRERLEILIKNYESP